MPFARVNVSGIGTTEILAAPGSGNKYQIYGYAIASSGAVAADFRDGDDTIRAGAFNLVLGGPIVYAGNSSAPAFECGTNQALTMNVNAVESVRGHLVYAVVGA